MAITEAGLAWCSNSSNSLTSSSRPRFPERKRSAMARSSSKQRSRTRRDMPTGHGTASSPASRRYYLTCCPGPKASQICNPPPAIYQNRTNGKRFDVKLQVRKLKIAICTSQSGFCLALGLRMAAEAGAERRQGAPHRELGRHHDRGAGQPGFSVDDARGRGEPATRKAS